MANDTLNRPAGPAKEQTRANHVRLHAPFHFFLVPLLAVNLALCLRQLSQRVEAQTVALTLISIALFPIAFLLRTYALKVQDRLIRLEEQLRFDRVLPEPLRSRAVALSVSQIVALRFASDAELPNLVRESLEAHLSPGDIKSKIVDWRPDTFRV